MIAGIKLQEEIYKDEGAIMVVVCEAARHRAYFLILGEVIS
jgi:hypothetical protein